MALGAFFPNAAFRRDPAAIKDWAQTIEGLGYDYIDVPDHTVGVDRKSRPDFQGPYDLTRPYHETFVMMGFLAAVTERVRLRSAVLILPQRQTALVAKQAAEVDILSGGRLDLGVGVGWNKIEYEALHMEWGNRGRRQGSQIEAMQKLWTEDIVDHENQWETLRGVGLNPQPVQKPIPIWFGGSADGALRRAARYGDGWIPLGAPDEAAIGRLETLRGYLRAEGRANDRFGIECWIRTEQADPEGWVSLAQSWRDIGATEVTLYTAGTYLDGVAEHLQAFRDFKARISG